MAYDELRIGNKGPARDNNNLSQEANNVSDVESDANFKQTKTLKAIDQVNKLYSGAGYSNVAQFMKNMAATESNVGRDALSDVSFGATQIDPIRYQDIVQRASENPGSAASTRANMANSFLRKTLNRPDFDILDLDLTKEGHNPYISAALTRMGLANLPGSIPEDLEGQAEYWKDNWNTESGAGTPEHFMKQSRHHFPENTVDEVMEKNTTLENAFKY
jgi:hypothetical protein